VSLIAPLIYPVLGLPQALKLILRTLPTEGAASADATPGASKTIVPDAPAASALHWCVSMMAFGKPAAGENALARATPTEADAEALKPALASAANAVASTCVLASFAVGAAVANGTVAVTAGAGATGVVAATGVPVSVVELPPPQPTKPAAATAPNNSFKEGGRDG
jgi:hypothetical protein